MNRKVLACIVLMALLGWLKAGETQVSLSATHNLALIGDRIGVTLLVKAERDTVNIEVDLLVDPQVCEIVAKGVVSKRTVPEGVVLEQKYELAFFDLGDFDIGPARVVLLDGEDKETDLSSNRVPITIKESVRREDQELAPGKAPRILSGSPLYLLKMVWLPLSLLLLGLAAWFLIRKSRKGVPDAQIVLSPLQIFEKEMNDLLSEGLFEKGFKMLFFLRLTHVMKKFLQGWHKINAEEMTSEELCWVLQKEKNGSPALPEITAILGKADLAKFARYEVNREEYGQLCEMIEALRTKYRQKERENDLIQDGRGGHV